jgi:hypothetical protein
MHQGVERVAGCVALNYRLSKILRDLKTTSCVGEVFRPFLNPTAMTIHVTALQRFGCQRVTKTLVAAPVVICEPITMCMIL